MLDAKKRTKRFNEKQKITFEFNLDTDSAELVANEMVRLSAYS